MQEERENGPSLAGIFNLAAQAEGFFADFPARRADTAFQETNSHIACMMPGDVRTIILPVMEPGWHQTFLVRYFNYQISTGLYHYLPRAAVPADPLFHDDGHWAHMIFDHECGHSLIRALPVWKDFPKGLHKNRTDECFADVYSIMRHVQRFGVDTGFARAVLFNRARMLPGSNGHYSRTHMTADSVLAVMKEDFETVRAYGPEETVDAALKLALETALTEDMVDQRACAAVHLMKQGFEALPGLVGGMPGVAPELAEACLRAIETLHPARTAPSPP